MLTGLWMVSDFVVMLAASSLILCLLLAGIRRCMKALEKKMDRGQEIRWLKASLLYLLFLLPVITEAVLFTRTYQELTLIESFGKPFVMRMIVRESFTTANVAFSKHWMLWLVTLVWGAGFLYFGVYRRRREKRVLKCLREMSRQVEEGWLWELTEKLCRELKVCRPVCLYTNGLVVSPFVEGKKIHHVYLPEGLREDAETELMLRHELTHCACGDTRYREYLHWLCALYWFLPPVYRFAERFVEVNEMACDEAVLRVMPEKFRYRYAKLICDLASEEKTGMVETGFSFPRQREGALERRVENMTKKRKSMNGKWAIILTAALLAVCPATTLMAADGVSIAQDAAANLLIKETELTPMELPEYQEIHETSSQIIMRDAPDRAIMEENLITKGMTEVDVTVNGIKGASIATVSLSKGDTVSFMLDSDKTTDKFRAGLESISEGKTYVDSLNGQVWYVFTVPKTDTYTLFVEGTTNASVHITGAIIIK